MEVQVISKTIQKFNGESFYLCGNYFQRKGKRLHRAVWEYHNGEIPQGYDIHHKDHDRSNNQIDNLELLVRRQHHSRHSSEAEVRERSRKTIVKYAVSKAAEWHKSAEGLEWHSKQGKRNWEVRSIQTYNCTYCGEPFQTKHIYGKDINHFCCANHKAAYRRQRLRNESKECDSRR